MKKGEKGILLGIAAVVLLGGVWKLVQLKDIDEKDMRIPFYSEASVEVRDRAAFLIKQYDCKDCHTLWGTRNVMQSVPAPPLDGIGSLKTEAWLYEYLSSENPQSILPTRLKPEYRMPSYAHMPEADRRILAKYLASLKVEDWYLDEVKRVEREKLYGVAE